MPYITSAKGLGRFGQKMANFADVQYTQYPIIRNGDQRPPVEFLKISKILDSHCF